MHSVAYFVLLPAKLSDPAVLSDYVGESQIEGHSYHRVRVRSRAEGGGTDYQGTFFYWLNQQTHTMDYLAYSEGGPRFRKAINPQVVGGIRFQDYINYKGENDDATSVGTNDRRYQARQLTELSRIEQKNSGLYHVALTRSGLFVYACQRLTSSQPAQAMIPCNRELLISKPHEGFSRVGHARHF